MADDKFESKRIQIKGIAGPAVIVVTDDEQQRQAYAADTMRFERGQFTIDGAIVPIGMLLMFPHNRGDGIYQPLSKNDLLIFAAQATRLAESMPDEQKPN